MDGKIKLYKSIKIDGKEIKELKADFEGMPSNAIARATTFLARQQYPVTNPSIDVELNSLIFGISAGLVPEDAYRMHPKDKMAAAGDVILFFNDFSGDFPEEIISEK